MVPNCVHSAYDDRCKAIHFYCAREMPDPIRGRKREVKHLKVGHTGVVHKVTLCKEQVTVAHNLR